MASMFHAEVPVQCFSTAKDLLIWNNAIYSGKIISTNLLQQMTTVHQQIDDDPSLGKVSYGLWYYD